MKRTLVLLLHAFIGWAICGAIIGIGFSLTTESNTLIIHACAVPVVFGVIAWNYLEVSHHQRLVGLSADQMRESLVDISSDIVALLASVGSIRASLPRDEVIEDS